MKAIDHIQDYFDIGFFERGYGAILDINADDLIGRVAIGKRRFGADLVWCLALIKIDAREPGRGHFTAFLDAVETTGRWQAVYCEYVQTERLAAFLRRRGYQEVYGTNPPCMVLLKEPTSGSA